MSSKLIKFVPLRNISWWRPLQVHKDKTNAIKNSGSRGALYTSKHGHPRLESPPRPPPPETCTPTATPKYWSRNGSRQHTFVSFRYCKKLPQTLNSTFVSSKNKFITHNFSWRSKPGSTRPNQGVSKSTLLLETLREKASTWRLLEDTFDPLQRLNRSDVPLPPPLLLLKERLWLG